MAVKLKIKKGDKVVVIAGVDKGKQGDVLSVNRAKMTVTVDGANVNKKSTKPSAKSPDGGILEVPGSIHISNVMLIDAKGKATRVGRKEDEKGKLVRYSKKSGEVIK